MRFLTHAPLSAMKAAPEGPLLTSARIKSNNFAKKKSIKSLVEKMSAQRSHSQESVLEHMVPKLTVCLFIPKLQGARKHVLLRSENATSQAAAVTVTWGRVCLPCENWGLMESKDKAHGSPMVGPGLVPSGAVLSNVQQIPAQAAGKAAAAKRGVCFCDCGQQV